MLAVTFTMAIVGVLAVGQALVGISGGVLDLSQPAALVLTAFAIARLMAAGVPAAGAVVAALLIGAAWGLLNAAIIVYGKINPIIVTLGDEFHRPRRAVPVVPDRSGADQVVISRLRTRLLS